MSYNYGNLEEVLQEELSGAKIKVIGVGGGGGNMINHMIHTGVQGIELIVANTDAQVLGRSLCENRIQLGGKLTKGLGAGMVPEIGKESALENSEEIRSHLEGADIVFIAAGLGGGTGTGASPVIAQLAREAGALTISVVTKPFLFEGGKRDRLARTGLEELKKESDSIVVIPNDKLLSIVDKSLGIKESFRIVDEVLARAVIGTSGIILSSGENDINLDFADLRTVMSHRGLALMGMGQAEGEKSAYEAIKNAIESPLLDDVSIQGAMGILVHFNIHPNYPLIELNSAMEIIHESADTDATIIMGTTTDETLPETFVKITLIATGFEKVEEDKTNAITTKESDGSNLNIIQRRVPKPEPISNKPIHKDIPEKSQPSYIVESQDDTKQSSFDQSQYHSSFNQPQQQSSQSSFGQPQQQQSHNSFGQPQQQQSHNSFGQSQQQQSHNSFGQPQQQSHNNFGQSNQQQQSHNSFGQPQQQSQNSFGQSNQQQQNNFGQPPQQQQNSYGQQSQQQQQQSQQQNNFGQQPTQDVPKKINSHLKHQDKYGSSNDEYLDVPTWLRQRGK